MVLGGVDLAETKNSYKFFENRDCEYFPCHKGLEELNCLFCYCPMYRLERCPGNYRMIESGGKQIKSCLDCTFPHKPENYEKIMEILKRNM
ncbi:MAG: metal-binding protein [Lachnospiraceae bacterium]|nr:metal-binding protein [Lachnospiraceae bacterium]